MDLDSGADNLEVVAELDSAHSAMTRRQRRLLEVVAECDRRELWIGSGCRDLTEWLSARLGISNWAARRWIVAARALPGLPRLSEAFEDGVLGLDKVLELCRLATPGTEARLISWARRVTAAGIRRKADIATAAPVDDAVEADRSRYLSYWWLDDGRRLGLEGSLPAAQGAVVASALDRIAGRLPDVVEDEDDDLERSFGDTLDARRADALYTLASRAIAEDGDPDRATMVVHADLSALQTGRGGCAIEGGPIVHVETGLRLACDCHLEIALHNELGEPVGVGRASRKPPRWMIRQLRRRDRGCTFPGCEMKRFLHAHHIRHWVFGGRTDLDNLVLVCPFHHKLVHEYGWTVRLEASGTTTWERPGGAELERAPPVLLSA